MFEGLVDLKPGTAAVVPKLTTPWAVDGSRKRWTFNLRKGVKFNDGTPFNSAAVCFNFNRWYNFSGPFQDPGATFYYQSIFTGFHHNEASSRGPPLYRGCRTVGPNKVVILLNKP